MITEFFTQDGEFQFDYEIDLSIKSFNIGEKIFNSREKPDKIYSIIDIIWLLHAETLFILVEEVSCMSINLISKRITKEQEIELEKLCISDVKIINSQKCIKWALDTLKNQKAIPFSNLRSNETKYFDIIKGKVIEGVKLSEQQWLKKEQEAIDNGKLPIPRLNYNIAKPV